MNVSEQIDYDVQFMRGYFRQLFVFVESAASKTPEFIEGANTSTFQPVGVSELAP